MDHDTKSGGIWAVIPVKRFSQAKSRLSPVLTADERRHLSRVMLYDVLDAVAKVSGIGGILVVTCDSDAANMAKSFGCEVLSDKKDCGLCDAVSLAGRHLDARGCTGVICIPGDVPLVASDEIDQIILNHGAAPAVTLVPAWDGGGTNALLCTPAQVIAPQFGKNSFAAHKIAAGIEGLKPTVVFSHSLSLDLDEPYDLLAFLEQHPSNQTAQYLNKIRVDERLTANPLAQERRFG